MNDSHWSLNNDPEMRDLTTFHLATKKREVIDPITHDEEELVVGNSLSKPILHIKELTEQRIFFFMSDSKTKIFFRYLFQILVFVVAYP